MTQQVKKPGSGGQASAKGATGGTAGKATQSAIHAAESTQRAAQNVVNISTTAVREMLASGTGEAQKAQEKVWEIGREGMENFARASDAFTRLSSEMLGICRDNVEALIECCNLSVNAAREMSTEITSVCNRSFSDSVELSKDLFSCRTINDVVELQNRTVKQAVDTYFSETNKLCNLAFEHCTEALEPLNDRVAEASEQFCKAIAA